MGACTSAPFADAAEVVSAPMARTPSTPTSPKLGLQFPMWLLPVSEFLKMGGAPKGFQELHEEGLLAEWQPDMCVIFVSHQWVSTGHPDPDGEQLQELRDALKAIFSGELSVTSELYSELLYQTVRHMAPEMIERLRGAYIWYDYWSIPQISLAEPMHQAKTSSEMQRAVNSIPSYVDRADVFLALCPEIKHKDTGKMCDHFSWLERGWCRLEMTSHGLRTGNSSDSVIVLLHSASDVKFASALKWVDLPVGLGEFSVDSDREMLHGLVHMLLERYVTSPCCPDDIHGIMGRRYINASKARLLQGLGDDQSRHPDRVSTQAKLLQGTGCGKCHSPDDGCTEAFLQAHKFSSLLETGEVGLGPVHCAALEGRVDMLKAAVAAGADVDAGLHDGALELGLFKGTTPMHLAVLQGNSDTVQCLLELNADVSRSNSAGLAPIHLAVANASFSPGQRQMDMLELLLHNGADLEQSAACVDSRPLLLAACGISHKPAEFLLSKGADLFHSNSFGGILHNSLLWTGGKSDIVEFLVGCGADVNAAVPSSWLGTTIFRSAAMAMKVGLTTEVARVFSELEGATPLLLAAHMGRSSICATLLRCGADPAIRNAKGHTALDLARASGSAKVVRLLEEDWSKRRFLQHIRHTSV